MFVTLRPLALFLIPLAATPLAAQEPRATLQVMVTAAASGAPLRGAQVMLAATGVGGVTDATGTLRIEGLGPGAHLVEVRRLGYAPEQRSIQLAAGRETSIHFSLPTAAIPLAPIRVTARHGLLRLARTGFYDRRENGPGAFLTRDQIERRATLRLSDALRTLPGVQLAPTRFGDAYASMRRSAVPGRRCPIQYFLDGMPVASFNIDDVPARNVEALEIYRGASEIPARFNRGSAMCGVIVIWTRIDE